jgi:hypothetical protein
VIPLNQLIPECLLALGAAFLLGNLAAYVRLRPAWREAKDGRGAPRGKSRAKSARPRRISTGDGPGKASGRRSTGDGPGNSASNPRERRPGGAKAAAGPGSGGSGPVSARVREPTPSKSLPSRTRVLVNMMIGLVVTVAALAALIRG